MLWDYSKSKYAMSFITYLKMILRIESIIVLIITRRSKDAYKINRNKYNNYSSILDRMVPTIKAEYINQTESNHNYHRYHNKFYTVSFLQWTSNI